MFQTIYAQYFLNVCVPQNMAIFGFLLEFVDLKKEREAKKTVFCK